MDLNQLPNELLVEILNTISYEELPTIRKVCTKWNLFVHSGVDLLVIKNDKAYNQFDDSNYANQNAKCFLFRRDPNPKQTLLNFFQQEGLETRKLFCSNRIFRHLREEAQQKTCKNDPTFPSFAG